MHSKESPSTHSLTRRGKKPSECLERKREIKEKCNLYHRKGL